MNLEERALIGAVLIEDREKLPKIIWEILPHHFEAWEHRQIWIAIRVVLDQGNQPDIQSVCAMLGDLKIKALVCELEGEAGSLINLPMWAEAVRSHGAVRESKRKITEALSRAQETGSVEELREVVMRSGALETESRGPVGIGDILPTVLDEIETRKRDPEAFRLCRTGIRELDSSVELRHSQLSVLAARPGMGKSALACNIALSAGRFAKVVIFSLEMSRDQLVRRMLLSDECSGKLISIDDRSGLSIEEMRGALMQVGDPILVIVDYLQLIRAPKLERQDLRIGAVTKGLKSIAKDFRCHVLALAQLNRKLEGREDKRPFLADLRDSGQIEEDADNVWFIHRPGYYDSAAGNLAEIIIAKNRHGQVGFVRVHWDAAKQRFLNQARAE